MTYRKEDRPTPSDGIEITPEMIERGAEVLTPFDRLEMSSVYARILTEEILRKALIAG